MIELLFSYLVNIVSTHINFSFSAKWILSTYYIFFLSAASPGTVNKLSVMKIQTGLANTNMKLSVLFIVMQLLVLLAAQAIDLSPPPQQQQQQQGADVAASLKELQGEMAHPLGSQCISDCLAEKGNLVPDQLGECQQVEQQFDCTLYCMFDVEPRY